jgi:hypothetical protein
MTMDLVKVMVWLVAILSCAAVWGFVIWQVTR